ncbi:MAG: hypothetical protein DGJ47_000004 [Rickettsiaceae bacterium]
MGAITKYNIENWYIYLKRSPFTPPNYVFGIVWTTLYVMVAITGRLIWQEEKDGANLICIKRLYIFQLLLNFLWTPIFFYYHNLLLSLIVISILWLNIILLMYLSRGLNRLIIWLLVPYVMWVSFATYLTFYIWYYN